jgi:DNA-directed RNA polymerase I, II, and III subunit RPABC1
MDPRIINTCKEMIAQRGYVIESESDDYIICVSSEGEKIYIILISTPKFNIEKLTEYIVLMNQVNISHSIIIYGDTITPMTKKAIQTTTELEIELFSESELLFNITKHILVPIHEKLSEYENKVFKKRFGVKFPIILTTDPISRFFNFKKNDIIRVTRKNNYVSYLIVR